MNDNAKYTTYYVVIDVMYGKDYMMSFSGVSTKSIKSQENLIVYIQSQFSKKEVIWFQISDNSTVGIRTDTAIAINSRIEKEVL